METELAFCGFADLGRFFNASEKAKVNLFFSATYGCLPLARIAVPSNAGNAAGVDFGPRHVLVVFHPRNGPQIFNPVVCPVAVDVVNELWAIPSFHSPDDPVRRIGAVKDAANSVARPADCSEGQLSRVSVIPHAGHRLSVNVSDFEHPDGALFPSKLARLLDVVNQPAKHPRARHLFAFRRHQP
jgi:hypothetical protein